MLKILKTLPIINLILAEFLGKFLNKKVKYSDFKGYHKAIYAARNADTIAQSFL